MIDLPPRDRHFLRILADLAACNPFQPERIALEQEALGEEFVAEDYVAWSRHAATAGHERPNVMKLATRAEPLVERLRDGLVDGAADADIRKWYPDVVSYVLYYRHVTRVRGTELDGLGAAQGKSIAAMWRRFLADYEHFFAAAQSSGVETPAAGHLFACFYQVRRAFRYIFDYILGDSLPAARLRAMVWESIFTHDMRRYRRALYDRMGDLATLITGPSGTGKELVAQAIGLSQYLEFDPQRSAFVDTLEGAFIPLSLSALSPTLIESELFGHCKGAYTGAVAERPGWLEICPSHGAVFLDEIGELDPAIQVKLLRVVQTRSYSRLGETQERRFAGKIIAATHRDLSVEIREGRFREDLFYRLCSDTIQTPSLRDHLHSRPGALRGWIEYLAQRIAGDAAEEVTAEAVTWIEANLGDDYPWPGNIRELEQCVRNLLVRRDYSPSRSKVSASKTGFSGAASWLAEVEGGTLTADELLGRYCTWVYFQCGSYQQAAERLGLDRRTVRSKVDGDLLSRLEKSASPASPLPGQPQRHESPPAQPTG